ncbi:MAG: response regulator [Ignavibacteriaceae bacterium]|nr:response regulator [Ignavibacteriaceae bacterium]
MSSVSVSSIYQDRTGYLWFLTDEGLDRYDGYTFTSYKYPKKSKVLYYNLPGTISEDNQGNIWFASFNGGLEKFDPETITFKNYLPDPQHPATEWGNWVLEVYFDKHDVMWIGTAYGFYKYNEASDSFTQFLHNEDDPNSLGHNSVNGIYEDKSGTLWLATGGGLDKFDRETNKFYHYWHYPNNQWGDPKTRQYWLQAIIEDGEGVLWIGTDGGLLKFDKNSEVFTLYNNNPNTSVGLARNTILSLCIDGTGLIWLGTQHGIDVFNKSTKTFTNYIYKASNPESLSANEISAIILDRSGSMWISTNSRGVNKLEIPSPIFEKYTNDSHSFDKSNFNLTGVTDLFEDSEGIFWVGTQQAWGILDSKSHKVISKYNYNDWGIGHDISGNKLIAPTVGGLYKSNKDDKWTCYLDSVGATFSEFIFGFYQRDENYFWIGTLAGDLFKFFTKTKERKLIINIKYQIWTIYEDSFGLIWFGGFSSSLHCYDPNKDSIRVYNSVSEDSSTIIDNSFYSFYEDKDKTLWLGCGTGLVRFNRSKNNFSRFYGNDGFLSEGVKQIIEDDQSNLWISTSKGVTRFDPHTAKFKDFYAANYFPEIKLWNQVGCKMKDGKICFGGKNGFIRFHPDSIKEDTFIPPIAITAFKKFDKYSSFGKEIELKHDDNYLTLEFAALSYINSEENQYAYLMEGIDKEWVYCGTRRFATYPNLNPGEYTFKVKGSTCNRVWNEAGTSLKIIILPPWWKTWWAYLLYTIVLVSIFVVSTRFYLNRQRLRQKLVLESEHAEKLEEIAKMKSDFFANISHEFRTPLTLILGPAEKIEKNQSTNPVKDASIITRNSRRLLQLVNQLLDLSKLDAGKLKLEASPANIISFIKGIALSFESLSEARDVMIKIKSDKEFVEVYFDREKMFKTFSNLLSNAFKFTPERENVIINISETLNNTVEIRIRNTGIGIPRKELPKLFDRFYQVDSSQIKEYEGTGIGLALVKELIELHHGSISVDSKESNPEEKEKGWTEFTISLPLGRAHLKDDEILVAEKEVHKEVTPIDDAEYMGPRILVESEMIPDESRTTILVVEDNYDMREYIKESLSDTYAVEEAVNGEQGVRMAENIIPDLIISDLMMPKMDGNELTRVLKNDERTSHIPIIILTAKSGQENKIEGLQTGADDYLTKPFDLQELRVRVENLINIRKKLQEKFSKGEFLSKPVEKKLKSIDEKFLAKVLEVIEKHLSEEEFSIEECSSEVGLSRTHFHKKLRALVGKSPSQYVRTVRLFRAKQMIEEEKGNVSEIAYSVGFSSPAYFSRCFKEEFGYPPRDIIS